MHAPTLLAFASLIVAVTGNPTPQGGILLDTCGLPTLKLGICLGGADVGVNIPMDTLKCPFTIAARIEQYTLPFGVPKSDGTSNPIAKFFDNPGETFVFNLAQGVATVGDRFLGLVGQKLRLGPSKDSLFRMVVLYKCLDGKTQLIVEPPPGGTS